MDILSGFKNDMGITQNLPGITVARIRCVWGVNVDTAPVGPFTMGVFGFITNDSKTPSEVPRPVADEHSDWMAWQPYILDNAVGANGFCVCQSDALDVRSMRKLEEINDSVYLVLESTAGGVSHNFFVSTLLLLP